MKNPRVCIIIPSRLGSSRFPNKPLVDISGKSMIQRVYEKCKLTSADYVIVSTEDQLIYDHVKSFGECHLTPKFENGTLRVCYTAENLDNRFDFIINVQGDQPFIDEGFLQTMINKLTSIYPGTILTGASEISDDQLKDINSVKLIGANSGVVKAFTRSPFFSRIDHLYKHVGIYALHSFNIEEIAALMPSNLSSRESLEQIRWMEEGFTIKYLICYVDPLSIDTPEDLKKLDSYLKKY